MAKTISGCYSYTLSLSGVPGVGKTAIFKHVKRKAEGGGTVIDSGTVEGGIDCCIYTTSINGVNFKISLYDTGGLERYASLTNNYYHRTHAVILVYLFHKDHLDTITRLQSFIDNAIYYNKCPSSLVFSVWGHDAKDTPPNDKPNDGPLPELAKALMEGNEIPLSLHHTVCPQDDDDSRLMNALDHCILEIHAKHRPKADSVLTPGTINLGDSLDNLSGSLSEEHRLAGQMELFQHHDPRRGKRRCCKS